MASEKLNFRSHHGEEYRVQASLAGLSLSEWIDRACGTACGTNQATSVVQAPVVVQKRGKSVVQPAVVVQDSVVQAESCGTPMVQDYTYRVVVKDRFGATFERSDGERCSSDWKQMEKAWGKDAVGVCKEILEVEK